MEVSCSRVSIFLANADGKKCQTIDIHGTIDKGLHIEPFTHFVAPEIAWYWVRLRRRRSSSVQMRLAQTANHDRNRTPAL